MLCEYGVRNLKVIETMPPSISGRSLQSRRSLAEDHNDDSTTSKGHEKAKPKVFDTFLDGARSRHSLNTSPVVSNDRPANIMARKTRYCPDALAHWDSLAKTGESDHGKAKRKSCRKKTTGASKEKDFKKIIPEKYLPAADLRIAESSRGGQPARKAKEHPKNTAKKPASLASILETASPVKDITSEASSMEVLVEAVSEKSKPLNDDASMARGSPRRKISGQRVQSISAMFENTSKINREKSFTRSFNSNIQKQSQRNAEKKMLHARLEELTEKARNKSDVNSQVEARKTELKEIRSTNSGRTRETQESLANQTQQDKVEDMRKSRYEELAVLRRNKSSSSRSSFFQGSFQEDRRVTMHIEISNTYEKFEVKRYKSRYEGDIPPKGDFHWRLQVKMTLDEKTTQLLGTNGSNIERVTHTIHPRKDDREEMVWSDEYLTEHGYLLFVSPRMQKSVRHHDVTVRVYLKKKLVLANGDVKGKIPVYHTLKFNNIWDIHTSQHSIALQEGATNTGGNRNPNSGSSRTRNSSRNQTSIPPHMWCITYGQLMEVEQQAIKVFGESGIGNKTMRDICREIIGPTCCKTGTCFALSINKDGLPVDVFVTHGWDGQFSSFVQQIRNAFQTALLKPNLWICAFALQQGQDIAQQIGSGEDPLEMAPFVQALKSASGYCVVRNSNADIYSRIWCVCELIYAQHYGLFPAKTHVTGPDEFSKQSTVLDAQASCLRDRDRILKVLLTEFNRERIDDIVQCIRTQSAPALPTSLRTTTAPTVQTTPHQPAS